MYLKPVRQTGSQVLVEFYPHRLRLAGHVSTQLVEPLWAYHLELLMVGQSNGV